MQSEAASVRNLKGIAEKNQLVSDYSAFIAALLPGIAGVICHDRKGREFWRALLPDDFEFPKDYEEATRILLQSPTRAATMGKVSMGDMTAFIHPLADENDFQLGLLAVVLNKDAESFAYEDIAASLEPVLSSIQRELSLRIRLVDTYRQLSVRAAEENLLHQVEKLTHSRRSAVDTFEHVLLLCRKFLKISGAAIVIPEKNIELAEGDSPPFDKLHTFYDDSVERSMTASQVNLDSGNDVRFDEDTQTLILPISFYGDGVGGILALSGWKKSDFSPRRRRRIARYVVAHIQEVMERDYDALTGLMSWALFETKIAGAMEEGALADAMAVYFNIDQLGVINDNCGRDTGNETLVSFAKLAREKLTSDLFTRVSGDSFGAVLFGADMEAVRDDCNEICRLFRETEYVRDDQVHRVSVSIGVGPVDADADSASAVLAAAKVACKAAKDRGRGRVECYEPADASIVRRMDDIQWVGHIRSAIDNDRLVLVGQPIIPVQGDHGPYYFEVLVRLLNGKGQYVMPAEFLSAAENYQLMEELDSWVVAESLREFAAFKDQLDGASVRLAINLSGQSLGSESFLPYVVEQIEKSGVPGESLCFEITESVAVANLKRAKMLIHALKDLGCHISLDDFGTGLSSFGYLKEFSIDTVKIDGSFVRDITTNIVSHSVVAAIAEVSRVMELETVAEYVQDEAGLKLLRELGVTWAQGFLVGIPEPLAERLAAIAESFRTTQLSN